MQEVLWQRRFCLNIDSVSGMHKTKNLGMKCLSFRMKAVFPSRRIYGISQQRMPNTGHMYPYLVGTACFQSAFDKCVIPEAFQYLIMGNGLFSIFVIYRHPFSVRRISADRGVYRSLLFFQTAVYNGSVFSCDRMGFQLPGNGSMCKIIFADKKRACRIPVNPVNNAGPHYSVNTRQTVLAMV